jgi:hypothetical protein
MVAVVRQDVQLALAGSPDELAGLEVAVDAMARDAVGDENLGLFGNVEANLRRLAAERGLERPRPGENPVQIWPPLRPEAPQATVPWSSSATVKPRALSSSAADSPVKPAPTTATSASMESSSAGKGS